jgi:hypothetical protein
VQSLPEIRGLTHPVAVASDVDDGAVGERERRAGHHLKAVLELARGLDLL